MGGPSAGGRMSAVTRFKQSISNGKERKATIIASKLRITTSLACFLDAHLVPDRFFNLHAALLLEYLKP
ncbi:hypothetical protein E2C01_027508 [Portunus trituberculatus]|uniref:Uncharacterized protein n=1 Tax=Portunus trituberculatus TaxID=210409 RepID=A0A5B7ELT9_PORTR|nr:hypothetical protein [Portunus trituberculatus]